MPPAEPSGKIRYKGPSLTEIRRDPDYRRLVIGVRVFIGGWLFALLDVTVLVVRPDPTPVVRAGAIVFAACWCVCLVAIVWITVARWRLNRRYMLRISNPRSRDVNRAIVGDVFRLRAARRGDPSTNPDQPGGSAGPP